MREFKSNHIITKKILPVLLSPFLVISEAKAADSIAFPFDPILAGEIKKVVLFLKKTKAITGKSFFNVINLKNLPGKKSWYISRVWVPGGSQYLLIKFME
jgi:hypothetical protein